MAEQADEKLIEVARHIARTLGRTETMTDDILQIFSNFDGRFSREKFSEDRRSNGSSSEEQNTPAFSSSSIVRTIDSLGQQISHFLSSDRTIWSDADAFLDSVDSLVTAVRCLNSSASADQSTLDRADDLLQQCMLRLEDEFRTLIENPYGTSLYDPVPPATFDSEGGDSEGDDDRIPVATPVTDYDFVIDALPPGSVADLHKIAQRMVAAGFGRECAHSYSLARRDFIEESISRLGIRHRAAAADEIQATPWAELEDEICRWVKAVNVAFRILFPSERRLCHRIFSGLSTIADLSFAEACRDPAVQLLQFADLIASSSRTPERLFRVVDMYEALRDVVQELDPLFSDQYSSFLCSEVVSVWKKLGAAIRGIFTELDNLIKRDPATAAVPGGALHPIARYVMNYIRAASASRQTLEEVMDEDRMRTASVHSPDGTSSPLAVQIAWIMEVLQGNLEAKAKAYREPALSCIFLMNNGRYMMQKVRDSSELTALMGEEWIRRQAARERRWASEYQKSTWSKVRDSSELTALMGEEWIRRQAARERRWASEYQKSTWSKVTAVLRVEGSPVPTVSVMRERLKVFDVYLEETWRAQTGWVVADEQLRTELKAAAANMVLPAYRRFLGVYRGVIDGGKISDKTLRHSPQEVEARINELFEGRKKTPAK
ncbi:hypothetical protein HPP92_017860 [Vanilla planifolia]|uniref:Exocyst subunit Exo70 family protein n=1 Tax=Vanilla planifolia TaxID=51239 RepID=A0A835Q4Q6_VANPL|nr:hypothetical protein HPP92_017860 [Vanilla planifolia]